MAVLNLPIPKSASPAEVIRCCSEALAAGQDVCVATVIHRSGSSPSTPGQKLLLRADGMAVGTVGGGGVERDIVERMQAVLASGKGEPELIAYDLLRDLGMACGGRVDIVLEPMWGMVPVLLIGAGHVGYCLAKLLLQLGFSVTIIDEREATLTAHRLEGMGGLDARVGKPEDVARDVPRRAAVIVATHEHGLDKSAVEWAVAQGFSFVGGVGSRAKGVKIRKALVELGVADEVANRVRMPVGLNLGGRTPDELAVAIAGELIAWRAKDTAALEAAAKAW